MSSTSSTPSVTYSASPSSLCVFFPFFYSASSSLLIPPEKPVTIQWGTPATGLIRASFSFATETKSVGLGQTLELLVFVLHAVCINVKTGSLCSSLPANESVCSLCWLLSDSHRGALSACPAHTKCHAKCCAHCHSTSLFAHSCCATPSVLCHAPVCCALGRSGSLEAFRSPSVAPSTTLSSPDWLLRTCIRLGHVASVPELGNPPVQLKVILINEK